MIGRRSFLDNADAEETFVIRILQKLVGQRMLDMRRAIEQQQDASSGIFLTAGASFFSESDWNELLSVDFDRGRLFPASPYPAPDRRTCEEKDEERSAGESEAPRSAAYAPRRVRLCIKPFVRAT